MQFTLCRQVLFFYQALVLVESSLEQVACYVTWRCYFVQCYLLTLVFNMHSDLVKVGNHNGYQVVIWYYSHCL